MRKLAREPLVHFLAIGTALFAVFYWAGTPDAGSRRIVVTDAAVRSLSGNFSRTWLRPPTAAELRGLVDSYVRDELLYREAITEGLDRGDPVVRQRMAMRMKQLAQSAASLGAPTDEQLQAYLDEHAERFRREPTVSFRQVFVSVDRRGRQAESDARRLLTQLNARPLDGAPAELGDSIGLAAELHAASLGDVSREFGESFAVAVLNTAPGRWSGPLQSPYGLHLVLVQGRTEGSLPPLDDVREEVAREWSATREQQASAAMYERVRDRYTVVLPDLTALERLATASFEGSR